jgi:arylsulfatase A-like enzyme
VRFVLPEALQAAGIYTAAIVGSPVVGKAMGFDRGFTEHREIEYETVSQAEQFRPVLRTWIEEHAAQRFLLYIHFREPHAPYDPPAPYDTMFGPSGPAPRDAIDRLVRLAEVGSRKLRPAELAQAIRLYDGGLAYVDHEVGILTREMSRLGLIEKTVFVVAADHGEALTEHGHIGHNAQVYRESVQIPLIFRFPQRLRLAGMRVPDVVDLLDVAPTFAEIFGVDPPKPPDPPFLGSSLLDLLAGERRSKPLVARSAGSDPQYAWREDGWAYLLDTETALEELFETGSDPNERVNRLETDPLRAALLRQSFRRWKLAAKPDASVGSETDLELTREQQSQLRILGYLE